MKEAQPSPHGHRACPGHPVSSSFFLYPSVILDPRGKLNLLYLMSVLPLGRGAQGTNTWLACSQGSQTACARAVVSNALQGHVTTGCSRQTQSGKQVTLIPLYGMRHTFPRPGEMAQSVTCGPYKYQELCSIPRNLIKSWSYRYTSSIPASGRWSQEDAGDPLAS